MTRTFKPGDRVAIGRGGPRGEIAEHDKVSNEYWILLDNNLLGALWVRASDLIPLVKVPKIKPREWILQRLPDGEFGCCYRSVADSIERLDMVGGKKFIRVREVLKK